MKKGFHLFIALSLFGAVFLFLKGSKNNVELEVSSNKPEQVLPSITQTASTLQKSIDENVISESTFQELLDETLLKLPKNIEVRQENDHHHRSPEILIAAKQLGAIRDAIKENPNLISSAMDFYSRCAEDEELIDAVRISCITNLATLGERQHSPVELSRYPSRLVAVYQSFAHRE